jgi:hypothetical protein
VNAALVALWAIDCICAGVLVFVFRELRRLR